MTHTDMLKNAAVAILVVAWLWGVVSYAMAGNGAGAIGAFVVPPVGVLHAAGLF
jgi:hypothetical protein